MTNDDSRDKISFPPASVEYPPPYKTRRDWRIQAAWNEFQFKVRRWWVAAIVFGSLAAGLAALIWVAA